MKLLHLGNWHSTNIGNGALIFGVERLLKEDLPGEVEIIPEAWDDYTFGLKAWDQKFVDLVNQHDALVVNGAVTFNSFRRNMQHTGMRMNLPIALWEKIEKPIVFYGLSYLNWPFQLYPNTPAATAWLSYITNRKNVFFGVRNDGTKEWMKERFGMDSDNVIEVPDPGLFVPHEEHEYPELHPTRKNVIIAFNGEFPVYRFATKTQIFFWNLLKPFCSDLALQKLFTNSKGYKERRRAIAAQIARAAEMIEAKHDVQFILVPHYLDDYVMIDEFIAALVERIAHQRTVSTGLVKLEHTAWFYGRYAKADLAISMRVHSMSPSIGLGIAEIPVTSDERMNHFLEKAGIADIGVDVSEADFGTKIGERAVRLLDDATSFKKQTTEAVARMRTQAKCNNDRIFRLIQGKS